MIDRIYTNPNVINGRPATNSGTAQAEATGSFASVYNRMQELRTAAANRTASPYAAQAVETAPSYSYVYAPGRGGVYAPRLVDLKDPEATLTKLEKLDQEITEKGLSGFFDGMDANESFAYLFERYADEFGADFYDFRWQHIFLTNRNEVEKESDSVKIKIFTRFSDHTNRARNGIFQEDKYAKWFDNYLKNDEVRLKNWAAGDEAFANYFGYGDMTPEERYQAILADFNAQGDRSYAATIKLLWLLGSTGAVEDKVVNEAISLVDGKMAAEYAALDMTVTDMAKSRYANSLYGFDAAAYLLGMVDYIQHAKETSIVFNYDSQTIAFFEKLTADLQALSGAGGIL